MNKKIIKNKMLFVCNNNSFFLYDIIKEERIERT